MPAMTLSKRTYICGQDQFGNYQYCNSTWSNWGRWVALGAIVVAAFLVFFLLACLSARRRKRHGTQPYYGTGWAGRVPVGHAPAQYSQQQPYYGNQQQPYNNQAAPPYSASQGGYYGGQNQSYYGGQQTGIELQQPDPAHQYPRGGDNVYEPPTGPPPKKEGDAVR